MATTTLKGIVKEVKPIEFYGEGSQGRRQTLVLFVPGYVDEFGDKKGRDETWGIDIYNKNIEKHNLNSNCVDKRAKIDIYISSSELPKKDSDGVWYAISATLKNIQFSERTDNQNTSDLASSGQDDDDLPF